jgi:hypothetical protein
VTGWALTLSALSISLAAPTTITGHDGAHLEGDRFEFAPHQSPVTLAHFFTADVRAHGMEAFTLTSEVTEDARVPELRVHIERASPGLLVSWPHHPNFYLAARSNLGGDQVGYDYGARQYRDFRWYLPVNPTNKMRFFSLRHIHWYYNTP